VFGNDGVLKARATYMNEQLHALWRLRARFARRITADVNMADANAAFVDSVLLGDRAVLAEQRAALIAAARQMPFFVEPLLTAERAKPGSLTVCMRVRCRFVILFFRRLHAGCDACEERQRGR
jgi:hypothetical protein